MKSIAIPGTGVIIILMISLCSCAIFHSPSDENGLRVMGSWQWLPGHPGTSFCSFSGHFPDENGKCLVFLAEFRNLGCENDPLNIQIDIYLYDTFISREKTITKRLEINPKGKLVRIKGFPEDAVLY